MKNKVQFLVLIIVLLGAGAVTTVSAQGTAFVYQGKLSNGPPQTGQFDFTFKLFTAQAPGGTQIGATFVGDNVTVTIGVFKVNLDFGSAPFSAGTGNYLEIAVRTAGCGRR